MTHNLETKSCFGDLFDKLNPEKKVEIIKPKVVRNETLDLIIEKYKEGLENYGLYKAHKLKIKIPENEYLEYYIAKSSAPSEIQSERITEFSLLLGEYENKKDFESFRGFYLSALINGSKDKDFKIITNYLRKTINFIGYENAKNIDVNGNAGDWVGYEMKRGEITIDGNAGWGVGYEMKRGEITVNGNAGNWVGDRMKRGEITVNGNAGNWVGEEMGGGKITVNGNAGNLVGWYMKDGEIHLNGDYESLSDHIKGGNIYHKGKLIVENGRKRI